MPSWHHGHANARVSLARPGIRSCEPDRSRPATRPAGRPTLAIGRPVATGRERARRASARPHSPRPRFELNEILPVIRREVRRYKPWRLERADLMQAGVVGALEAWHRLDASRSQTFRPYAAAWIRKELQRTVAAGDFTIAVPADVPAGALHLRRQLDAGQTIGSLPDSAPLHRLLDAATPIIDLEADLDGLQTTGASAVEDEVADTLERDEIRRAVRALPEPQRTLVWLRFGFDGHDDRSAREVARLVGVSDFTVRAHLRQAMRSLQDRLTTLLPTDAVLGMV